MRISSVTNVKTLTLEVEKIAPKRWESSKTQAVSSRNSLFAKTVARSQYKIAQSMAKTTSNSNASTVAQHPNGSAGATPIFVSLVINGNVTVTM
jgi:hypothetical protein